VTVLGSLTRRPQNAVQSTPWGDWGDSSSTPQVTTSSALQLLTVYGCNRFICDGISTLPVDVLRRSAAGAPVSLKTPRVIATPTTDLDFASWATQVLTSLLMAGNFYGLRVYVGTVLDQVIPLDPEKVKVERQNGRKVFNVDGKVYGKFDILHIPGVMWPGSDVGMSPLEAARQTIGQGMSAQEFGTRFFGQDATMPGVIEIPGELVPDQAKAMAQSWSKARRRAGQSKSNLPGVLQGGATWKQTGVTNEQSQFLETRKFTASEIASQMFQIDPAEMGLPVDGSSLTYANLEQRNARKVQVTFLPWITRLETALTSMLPRPQYVKLNVNGLLRGDTKTRFEAYGVGIDKKFILPNEARDFEDWAPIDGGDEFTVPPAPVAPVAPNDEES
jgi:HK97 family phage portal protein